MNTLKASVEIQIPFEDVDMFDIAWHGHYAKYFEVARCQLLDNIGYTYRNMRDDGFMYPVVDLHIKYIKPIVFGQTIRVTTELAEWQQLLKFDYQIQDAESDEPVARGISKQAAVRMANMELLRVCPDEFAGKIQVALDSSSE